MKNETYIKKNGDFLMRELTEDDLEQFNDLLRYAFQVTTDELVKSGWEDEEIKYAKTPILKSSYVLGWFYKGTLASMVVVYPMKVNIYDEIYEMGGVTGVATYPEYAGRGAYPFADKACAAPHAGKWAEHHLFIPILHPVLPQAGMGNRLR